MLKCPNESRLIFVDMVKAGNVTRADALQAPGHGQGVFVIPGLCIFKLERSGLGISTDLNRSQP